MYAAPGLPTGSISPHFCLFICPPLVSGSEVTGWVAGKREGKVIPVCCGGPLSLCAAGIRRHHPAAFSISPWRVYPVQVRLWFRQSCWDGSQELKVWSPPVFYLSLWSVHACECSVLLLKSDRKPCIVLGCAVCRKAVFSIRHWDIYRYNYNFNNLWHVIRLYFSECSVSAYEAYCMSHLVEKTAIGCIKTPLRTIWRNGFFSWKSRIGRQWFAISAPTLQTGRVITQKSKGSLNFVYSKIYIIKSVLLHSRSYCMFVYLNLFIWHDEKTALGNFYFQYHIDFGWDRVNFLPSSSYGAMFWICDVSNVVNTPMFYLFLNSAYTARPSVCRTVQPARSCRCTRWWEGIHPGQPTQAVERVFSCHMASCSTIKGKGMKEEGWAFRAMVFVFQRNW